MAVFEFFHEMGDVSLDPQSGTLTIANEAQLEVVTGSVTVDFYGSFSYDGAGALLGGTLTGIDISDSGNGGLQVRVSGLNTSLEALFDFASSPDPAAVDEFLFNGADTLLGSPGDDWLGGYAGADSIVGGAGNDTLDGGNDNSIPGYDDTLVGGAGNDTYVLYALGHDSIVELPGGGVDTVVWGAAGDPYTLPANVENLTLDSTDSSRIQGIGNELGNVMTATGSNFELDGMAGDDTLVGGSMLYGSLQGGPGNDTYELTGSDPYLVHELPGEGIDTIRSTTDAGLPDNVENLVLLGTARSGGGNALANLIVGNDLGDTLDGGPGADTLIGGAGADTFKVDDPGDVVVSGGGNDTVIASIGGFVLPDGAKALYFTGIEGTGNASDNYIEGDDQSNVISALAGNDTIDGGVLGMDTIDGGDGIDVSVYRDRMANFIVTHSGANLNVAYAGSPFYIDTLISIERVQFTDVSVAFDIDGDAGKAYRLYQAAFARKPDIGGLGYQMHDLDIGVTLEQVASNFIASPEFQRTYGNVDNTQFLTLLYNNVLHRAPDSGGLQFHLDEFAHGETRAQMLIHFSESPENQANVIGDIQNGMVYIPTA